MSKRQVIADFFLYAAILFVGIVNGAEVYQRISIIPEWGGHLPESLIQYFQGTRAAASIGRFWGTCLPPTALLVIGAVAANWANRPRRKWLTLAGLLFLGALAWTEIWFVPKGVVPLMVRAGAGMIPAEITERAEAWIFWDWFRMAITAGCFLAMLKALTLPNTRKGLV
jgi:hypothetical protein